MEDSRRDPQEMLAISNEYRVSPLDFGLARVDFANSEVRLECLAGVIPGQAS